MSLKAKQELTSNLYAKSAQARADFLCFTPDPTNLISPPQSKMGRPTGIEPATPRSTSGQTPFVLLSNPVLVPSAFGG